MKQIINPAEVAPFLGIKLPFNPCDFRGAFNIELREFRKCLGVDFRDDLIAQLADYSAVDEYDPDDAPYALDALVKFEGTYYKSLTAGNTDLPSVKTKWSKAPKFSEAKYEELYCYFLGPYLAASILARRIPFIISQISDEGILEYNGSEYKSSDTHAIERLQKAVYAERQIVFENLDNWLTSDPQDEDSVFENYPGNQNNSDCETTECKTNGRPTYGQWRVG